MYTNGDGIMNKIDELKFKLLNDYKDVDLFAITESNYKRIVDSIEIGEINIDGFQLFSANFMIPQFRGIICYIRHSHYNS